jgi:hypothetical protein
MEKSRIDSAGLLAAAVAAVLILLLARSNFGFVTTAGGLTLLFVLFAYDQEGRRSAFQSLAFSAVCGFCLMLVSGIIFQFSLAQSNPDLNAAARENYFEVRLSAVWLFTTILLWAIDRARMSGRTTYETPLLFERTPGQRQFVPEFTGSFPAIRKPEPTPAPAAPAPAPPRAPEYAEPVARPITVTTFSAPPEAALPPPEPAAPQPVPPAAVPLPAGKETMIYVNLVGEGLNVLRSVRAEHLGRDFYKIIEPTPEGETWEYSAGQVVRCKKQKLSSGKALVAFEEAPRSQ